MKSKELVKLELIKVLSNYDDIERERTNYHITIMDKDSEGWILLCELEREHYCPYWPKKAKNVEKNLTSRRYLFVNDELFESKTKRHGRPIKCRYRGDIYTKKVTGDYGGWKPSTEKIKLPDFIDDSISKKTKVPPHYKRLTDSKRVFQETAYRLKRDSTTFAKILLYMARTDSLNEFHQSGYYRSLPYGRKIYSKFYKLFAQNKRYKRMHLFDRAVRGATIAAATPEMFIAYLSKDESRLPRIKKVKDVLKDHLGWDVEDVILFSKYFTKFLSESDTDKRTEWYPVSEASLKAITCDLVGDLSRRYKGSKQLRLTHKKLDDQIVFEKKLAESKIPVTYLFD